LDRYYDRHDGQAVTTEDFVQAMADASGVDLAQFRRWYNQAGTPVLESTGHYDAATQRYTLDIKQHCVPTPKQAAKLPYHLPLAIGLVDAQGDDMPLQLEGEPAAQGGTRVLSLTQTQQRFVFINAKSAPVPSLLRDFSAPVVLKHPYTDAQLSHLMAHDSDDFNRWEAGQRLATNILLSAAASTEPSTAPASFIAAFGRVLSDYARDPALTAEALSLPSEAYLGEQMEVVDPDAIYRARVGLRLQLAQAFKAQWLDVYQALSDDRPYSPDAQSAGRRALRNLCLGYLMEIDEPAIRQLCLRQFEAADNMTNALAALSALANSEAPERQQALADFYRKWKDEALVVDKWLSVQATSRLPDTLDRVRGLLQHEGFSIKNPNKVYALIGGFRANQLRFHAADGAGYAFLADQVITLDALNPQVAARMARGFDRWRKFDAGRQQHAQAALERVRDHPGLSKDVMEIALRALS
jgi:aminopeptidase N